MIAPSVEFEPYFRNLGAGMLSFPRCGDCGRHHWYPMKLCPHCRSAAIAWTPVKGDGRIFSWTTVRHAFDPKFDLAPPYVVALVEFPDAEGVRFVTNLIDADPAALAIGLAVEPVFPAETSPPHRLFFRLAARVR